MEKHLTHKNNNEFHKQNYGITINEFPKGKLIFPTKNKY
jgi:hypothetical protein